MPFASPKTLPTPSGTQLTLYMQHAKRRPRAVVQVNHGLAEHAGRYARFADFLAGQGFHVYAHDHRGHGATRAPGAPKGSFGPGPSASIVVADVLAVHEAIAADHPGLPVILFGHSMGAQIALNFLSAHPKRCAGAAIWNAPLATALEARAGKLVLAWERFRLGSDVPSRIMPRLTFSAWTKAVPDAVTPFDWLSRDPKEVRKYIEDPDCGWLPTVDMWRDIFDFNLKIAAADAFAQVRRTMPVQLVGGGADPSTKGGTVMRRLERRLHREGFSNLETRIYEQARHETLNEVNREKAMADFAGWAKKIAG
ncbi:alpha/beta hydrolase [Nitratireductor luteus]|uniref:alpha/beta hydrolase n=1 Tax=Nitratireductor luteus TaxID=2976980 RepID=UPI00223FC270|nr:alpha/beta hydrolase [Nitratireductor luteus]